MPSKKGSVNYEYEEIPDKKKDWSNKIFIWKIYSKECFLIF